MAELSNETLSAISSYYQIGPIDHVQSENRGLINETHVLNGAYFLTVFGDRSEPELETVAEIAQGLPDDIPITRPVRGKNGYSLEVGDTRALLMPRLPGIHHVGLIHTDKHIIATELHTTLASFYWRLQQGLCSVPQEQKNVLKAPSRIIKGVIPQEIPEIAKPITDYETENNPPIRSYADLIHDDMERQNILSEGSKITGVVDLDSIHEGDILYEFSHFMFNMVFCDPRANSQVAVQYIDALEEARIIDPHDIPTIYAYMYRFALSDVADFEDLWTNSNVTERLPRLDVLVSQYAQAFHIC